MDDIKKINDNENLNVSNKNEDEEYILFKRRINLLDECRVRMIDGLPYVIHKNILEEWVKTPRLDAPETTVRIKQIENNISNQLKALESYNMYYKNLVNFKHYEDRATKDDFTWELHFNGYTYVPKFNRYIYSEEQYMDCRDPKSTGDKLNNAWNRSWNNWDDNKKIEQILVSFQDELDHVMTSYSPLQIHKHLRNTFLSFPDCSYSPFKLTDTLYGNAEFYELLEQFNTYKNVTGYDHLCDYVFNREYINLHNYERIENCPKSFRFIYFLDACELLLSTAMFPDKYQNVSKQAVILMFAENYLLFNVKNKQTYHILEEFTSDISAIYNKTILSVLKIMKNVPDEYFNNIRDRYLKDYNELGSVFNREGYNGCNYTYVFENISEVKKFVDTYFSEFSDVCNDSAIQNILNKYMNISNNLNSTISSLEQYVENISIYYDKNRVASYPEYIYKTLIENNIDILNNWRIKDSDLQYTPLSELPDSVEYTRNHYYMNVIREGAESTFKQPKQKGVKNKLSFLKGLFVKDKK